MEQMGRWNVQNGNVIFVQCSLSISRIYLDISAKDMDSNRIDYKCVYKT